MFGLILFVVRYGNERCLCCWRCDDARRGVASAAGGHTVGVQIVS
uniref:Uncharacterized protein MANES_09G147700 n=1 Tax=Rhizophora mucronata TaxID=61149 RepID=A0A2P2P2M4_RHIMU